VLPDGKDFHAALLEYFNLALAKTFVQFIDAAFEIALAIAARIHRIHAQLETAGILRSVDSKIALDIWTTWLRRRRGSALAAASTLALGRCGLGSRGGLRRLRGRSGLRL